MHAVEHSACRIIPPDGELRAILIKQVPGIGVGYDRVREKMLHVLQEIRQLLEMTGITSPDCGTLPSECNAAIEVHFRTLDIVARAMFLRDFRKRPLQQVLQSSLLGGDRTLQEQWQDHEQSLAMLDSEGVAGAFDGIVQLAREHTARTPPHMTIAEFQAAARHSAELFSMAQALGQRLRQTSVPLFRALRTVLPTPRRAGASEGQGDEFTHADRHDITAFLAVLAALWRGMQAKLGTGLGPCNMIGIQIAERCVYSVAEALFLTFVRLRFPALIAPADHAAALTGAAESAPEIDVDALRELMDRKTLLFQWLAMFLQKQTLAEIETLRLATPGSTPLCAQLEKSCEALHELHRLADTANMRFTTRRRRKERRAEALPPRQYFHFIEELHADITHAEYTGMVAGCGEFDHQCVANHRMLVGYATGLAAVRSSASIVVHQEGGAPCLTEVSDIPLAEIFPPESAPVIVADSLARRIDQAETLWRRILRDLDIAGPVRAQAATLPKLCYFRHVVRDKRVVPWQARTPQQYLLLSRASAALLGVSERVAELPASEREFLMKFGWYEPPPDMVMLVHRGSVAGPQAQAPEYGPQSADAPDAIVPADEELLAILEKGFPGPGIARQVMPVLQGIRHILHAHKIVGPVVSSVSPALSAAIDSHLGVFPLGLRMRILEALRPSPLEELLNGCLLAGFSGPADEATVIDAWTARLLGISEVERALDEAILIIKDCEACTPRDGFGRPVSDVEFRAAANRDPRILALVHSLGKRLEEVSVPLFRAWRSQVPIPRSDGASNGTQDEFTLADRADIGTFVRFLAALHERICQRFQARPGVYIVDPSASVQAAARCFFSPIEALFLTFIRQRFPALAASSEDSALLTSGTKAGAADQTIDLDTYTKCFERKAGLFLWLEVWLRAWERKLKMRPDAEPSVPSGFCGQLADSCYSMRHLHLFVDSIKLTFKTARQPLPKRPLVALPPLWGSWFTETITSQGINVQGMATAIGTGVLTHSCHTQNRMITTARGARPALASDAKGVVHHRGGRPCLTHISDVPLAEIFPPESAAVMAADHLALGVDSWEAHCPGMLRDQNLAAAIEAHAARLGSLHFMRHIVRDKRPVWRRLLSRDVLKPRQFGFSYLLLARADAVTLGWSDEVEELSPPIRKFLSDYGYPLPNDPVVFGFSSDDGDSGGDAPPEPQESADQDADRPARVPALN